MTIPPASVSHPPASAAVALRSLRYILAVSPVPPTASARSGVRGIAWVRAGARTIGGRLRRNPASPARRRRRRRRRRQVAARTSDLSMSLAFGGDCLAAHPMGPPRRHRTRSRPRHLDDGTVRRHPGTNPRPPCRSLAFLSPTLGLTLVSKGAPGLDPGAPSVFPSKS
jgi:hypothetical protein